MKKVIRLTESDLIKLVQRIIKENDEESDDDYFYNNPAAMSPNKWYRKGFSHDKSVEPEVYSDDELDIEDVPTMDVDDDVLDPFWKRRYATHSPIIRRAKLKKQ